jgi:hypothetical protein
MPSHFHTDSSASFPTTQSSSQKQKHTTHTIMLPGTCAPNSTPSSSTTKLIQPQQPTKNFEPAFANLSSSYGYAGQAPSLPAKISKKSKSTKTSFTSKCMFTDILFSIIPKADYRSLTSLLEKLEVIIHRIYRKDFVESCSFSESTSTTPTHSTNSMSAEAVRRIARPIALRTQVPLQTSHTILSSTQR